MGLRMAGNNRKTKHRRRNGKLVTVRHKQYPDQPKLWREETESGLSINVLRKRHVLHQSQDLRTRATKKENLPRKGRVNLEEGD